MNDISKWLGAAASVLLMLIACTTASAAQPGSARSQPAANGSHTSGKKHRKPKTKLPSQTELTACESDGDCVVSCPNVKGCCGEPCGCRRVINKKYLDVDARVVAKECTRMPHCPAMDCAYKPALGAVCKRNRCVGVDVPTF